MGQLMVMDKEVRIKEYDGRRVVTFKDVDAVHERPDGTARKRFNDNREHFIEGEDYYKITPSAFRTALLGEMDARQQNDITLLTESGYLMLVKSFTDDLAWQVQRVLVNCYFRVNEQVAPKQARVRSKPEDVIFRQRLRMADAFAKATGVEIGLAYAVAIKEAERLTGADYTAWRNLLPMRSEERSEPNLNATEVGELVDLSARAVNKRLEEAGLQVKVGGDWQITEKGKEYGAAKPYERNGHFGNQILWLEAVTNVITGQGGDD